MSRLLLFRKTSTEIQTLGYFECPDGVTYPSLELPWKDNQVEISCIPAGVYRMTKHYAPTLKKNGYLLHDVPNRSEIMIHPANWFHELRGCMAPGLTHADIDGDGHLDVTSSKIAMGKLLQYGFTEIEVVG